MDEKYTLKDSAKLLKVSERTLLREIKKGKLKTQRIGRKHLISEKDLQKYLNRGSNKKSEDVNNLLESFFASKKGEMISLLQRCVSIPSISSEVGAEGKLAHLIKKKLDGWGIRSVIYHEADSLAVHASFGYADEALLLDSPLDTLPPGDTQKWVHPPFDGVIHDGKMYGRGTADAKAGIVCMMYTLLFLKKFVNEEKIRVELVFDGGEQDGAFSGMKQALKRGITATSGIIGYAGAMEDILIGARGYHRYQFTVHGKAVHTGSRYKSGVNAISKMAKLMSKMENIDLPKSEDPFFSFGSRLTFSQIVGGRAINMVPDECTSKVDIRVTPNITKKLLDKKISNLLARAKKQDKDLEVDWQYLVGQEAYVVSKRDKITKSLLASTKEVLARDLHLIASGPAHVGNLLNKYGIPMVVFGPKGTNVHSYDEYVEVDSLPLTSKIYIKAICNYFDLFNTDFSTDVEGWT